MASNTVEAERILVDHVAHIKPSDGGSAATQLVAHLTGKYSSTKMLNSRIRVLHHYLLAMQKGDIPSENSLLRQVSSLLRRLPAIESWKFQDDFSMEYNDTLLITYLAMFTNCSSTMNELVDKIQHCILQLVEEMEELPFSEGFSFFCCSEFLALEMALQRQQLLGFICA